MPNYRRAFIPGYSMNRKIICVALFLASMSVQASEWVLLGGSGEGHAVSIDKTSIKPIPGNMMSAWIKTKYGPSQKRHNISELTRNFRDADDFERLNSRLYDLDGEVALYIADCKGGKLGARSIRFYDSHGEEIKYIEIPDELMQYAAPDTVGGSIHKNICAKTPKR